MMAIDLANNGYNPSVELTQVKASPNLQDVQVRKDPNSKAQQLWAQFGNLEPQLKETQKLLDVSDKQRAEEFVNSMTTSELSQKIQNGEISHAQSPVFNAAVNKAHYNNIAQDTERETLRKLTAGEFKDQFVSDPESARWNPDGSPNPKFQDGNQKLEKYLLEQRAQLVQGADKFGIAGFDKNWQPFVEKALKSNSEKLANEAIAFGASTMTGQFVRSVAGEGTPEEKAARFMDAYQLNKHIAPNPTILRNTVMNALNGLADAGDVGSITKILNQPLDNGLTVGSTLQTKDGQSYADNLLAKASLRSEQHAMRAQIQAGRDAAQNDDIARNEKLKQAFTDGTLYSAPTVVSKLQPDGTRVDQSQESDIMSTLKAGTANMDLKGRLLSYQRAGRIDPESKNQISAAVTNIGSLYTEDPKKQAGTLNQQFDNGFGIWKTALSVDPSGKLARDVAGSESNYKVLNSVDQLMRIRGFTKEQAAGFVSKAMGSATYLDSNPQVAKSASKVLETLNANWFATAIGLSDPNAIYNIENIKKETIESINTLVASGMGVDDAIKSTKDDLAHNIINLNGNLVYARSLPSIPEAADGIVGGSIALNKRWLEEVGGMAAHKAGHDPKEVQMMVAPDGSAVTLMMRGSPLTTKDGLQFVYPVQKIEDWMRKDLPVARLDNMQAPELEAFRRKLFMSSIAQNSNSFDQKVADANAPAGTTKTAAMEYLGSRSGFRELKKAGLENKPREEQIKWAKEQILGGANPADAATPMDGSKTSKIKFDPEGTDYDYETAKANGMEPNGTGENKGHWGSVAPVTAAEQKQYGLPDGSYKILKGHNHETFHKAVDAEEKRGSTIEKHGDRYYSVPKRSPALNINDLPAGGKTIAKTVGGAIANAATNLAKAPITATQKSQKLSEGKK